MSASNQPSLAKFILQRATDISLANGKTLFRSGDFADACYWLKTGLLKAVVASPTGEQRIVSFLSPGSMVGELCLVDGKPRSTTVEAVGDCLLSRVSRSAFTQILEEHPEMRSAVMMSLASHLRRAYDETAAASFMTVKARIAHALLSLADQIGEAAADGQVAIRYRIRHSDIAAMAGLARESVSRVMADWGRAGFAMQLDGRLVVQPSGLAKELASPS